jgi:hypothetical protein
MIVFSLDDKNVRAEISFYKGSKVKSWYNYHITKHIIGDFTKESFFRLVGLSENEIRDIRRVQRSNYKCKVKTKFSPPIVCYTCKYVDSCWETLSNVRKDYDQVIINSLQKDKIKPRHVHVLKGNKIREELVVLNDNGVSIVMQEKLDRYYVNTCFRYGDMNRNTIQEKYSIMEDDEIRLQKAKELWRKKFRGGEYSSIEHQTVNWNPIEQ